jgi:hypothetical protein
MQLPILLETVAGNGYRASSGPPLALAAEGSTQEEALLRLRRLIAGRLDSGAQLVPLDVAVLEHPQPPFAMLSPDDPLQKEWKQAMADYRRQIEEDPNYL